MRTFARSILATLAIASASLAQQITITPDQPSGIYKAGDTAKLTISVSGEGFSEGQYEIRPGGLGSDQKFELNAADGTKTIELKSENPGWTLVTATGKAADGKKINAAGSAIFSPEQIKPAIARPDDFDSFWAAKIEELKAVPANPQLTSAPSEKEGVEYFQITMDNIRGTHIRGQLAKPAKEGKFPAMLVVQWAGVYGLHKNWVTDRAAEGWLALNINAHDLPIDQPAEFYKEQSENALKDYPRIGNEDRETSYFLRMYLSCYRAAEYLTTREDWNGEVLLVTGGSQGGMQALVTAAIHPRITAAIAAVPAGCDMTSLEANRAPGWPMWPWQAKDRDAEKVKQTGRYFDVVNFAQRIKCPVLVGIGGVDTTCPPVGIYAAVNQITSPKEIVYMPAADHGKDHAAYYARNGAWSGALRTGQPLPLAK